MSRTVWDDLREDARSFDRQYPETGHTLLHVPDRDADGAPEIDVERPRKAIGEANPLASILANASDTESSLRAIGVGSVDARILNREQRPTPDGTGFVAEWFWSVPSGEARAWPDQPTVIWTRLCGELWKLICGRVGELLPNAVTIDPVLAPSIGSDPNVIDSGLVMHWLAWSAEVAALRAKVGWRLSLRRIAELHRAKLQNAPKTFTQAPPSEVGHPVVPLMPSNKPWLEPAGWWHSTIQPAGAGLVATIDWLRKAGPEADARVVGAAEADPPPPSSERVQPSCEEARRPSVQRAHLRAAASFEWVCKERPDLIPTLPKKYAVEQWEYIRGHGCPAYEDDGNRIKIPGFESWRRQIRGGLRDPEGPKTSPRAGREHGSSIASQDQV